MDTTLFDPSIFRHRLENGGRSIGLLLDAAGEHEPRWKPASDRWNLVEIANHLADEESLDFRRRLRSLVEDPAREWPGFDTFAGVTSGEYGKRGYEESAQRFERERAASIMWLESLGSIDPDARYRGPRAGEQGGPPALSAGDLMLSWLAHDYFHIRQITRLRWDYLNQAAPPHRSDYAGRE